jgi:hypothetical protein
VGRNILTEEQFIKSVECLKKIGALREQQILPECQMHWWDSDGSRKV